MKLSTRARYALRLILDVAKEGGESRPISLAGAAERSGLSRGYLEQLALSLRAARLLVGVAGRKGGYRLARPAAQITVGDVVEATIGPIAIVRCLADPTVCGHQESCEVRLVYGLINARINQILREYTIADLMDPERLADISRQLSEHSQPPKPR
jgi:Rrf2 family protein